LVDFLRMNTALRDALGAFFEVLVDTIRSMIWSKRVRRINFLLGLEEKSRSRRQRFKKQFRIVWACLFCDAGRWPLHVSCVGFPWPNYV